VGTAVRAIGEGVGGAGTRSCHMVVRWGGVLGPTAVLVGGRLATSHGRCETGEKTGHRQVGTGATVPGSGKIWFKFEI
jgi:hypothetical protein